MSRIARSLLCVILLASAFFGSPASATAQGEVPPPPPNSETGISEAGGVEATGAAVIHGPSEAAGTLPGRESDEMESLKAFRLEHPALINAAPDYYSVAGSVFQPRSSAVKAVYYGAGCVYRSGDGGSDDNNSFTAPVNLPDGSVIMGVRLYGFDGTPDDMGLNLFQFSGTAAFTNALSIRPTGAPSYFSTYIPLSTPITVNNATRATSLIWYSYAASSALRLCGARILYFPPFPPVFSAAENGDDAFASQGARTLPQLNSGRSFATFIAGQDFHPRESGTGYSYGGAGCVTASSGEYFVSDADLPEGAVLKAAKLFYYNYSTSASPIQFFVTTYDGAGGFADLVNSTYSNGSTGYGVAEASLPVPHVVSQFNRSMVVQAALTGDPNVKFCGMQLLWEKNVGYVTNSSIQSDTSGDAMLEASRLLDTPFDIQQNLGTEHHYRFIAGSAFKSRDGNTGYAYGSLGCVHLTSGSYLTADLQLPAGAVLYGVRLYTYDNSDMNSRMFTAQYDMMGGYDEFLVGDSQGNTGNNSVYIPKTPNYIVDTTIPLALVWGANGVYDTNMQLCGMRVYYSVERTLFGVFLPVLQR